MSTGQSPNSKGQTTNRSLDIDRWLWFILALFTVLGVIYSLATPVLEASDEFKHYPYVQYVQTRHKLPVLDPETCRESPEACPWKQDGGQPPAYYALMAAITSWIDTSDLPELRRLNKHAFIGNPGQICNKNLIIHRPERERFPWQGAVLAIHLIRFVTLLFGAGTVGLTYLLAREVFPERPSLALGATSLTAFNPMFLFVSASVNNDALAILIGNLALLMMVRMAKPRSPSSKPGSLAVGHLSLGLVLGLGLLTKLSLLGLIPLAFLVAAFRIWRDHPKDSFYRRLALVIGHWSLIVLPALAVSGWWFLRNWRLYGDPTGLNAFVAVQGTRPYPPTLQDWLDEFVTFRWAYWGLFGGVNVMAPLWVYRFFDVLSLAGLVGFVVWIVRETHQSLIANRRSPIAHSLIRNSLWWIPALWGGVLFASVLRWTWISPAFQGRLMFPGIAGISTLLMLGLQQVASLAGSPAEPRRYRPALSLGVALILLLIAALLPFITIAPAYAQPKPLTLADVPTEALRQPMDVGGVARIVGWELEKQTVHADDTSGEVELVVYWETVAPDDSDYVSFAHLLGRNHELVGQINRHPACGMVPTSRWEPGQVWRDPYRIPVDEDASAPSRLWVEVGLYDPGERETLGAVRVGEAKLAPPESPPQVEHSLKVDLADGVTLRGYDLVPPVMNGAGSTVIAGETVTLTLYWEAREAPSLDYQVFVHLLPVSVDEPGGEELEPVAQGDGPPLMGDYPTSMWAAGEVIADPHPVALPTDLPPGRYRLLVGMYDLETITRLPRLDGAGDSVEIPTTLEVRRSPVD